MRAVFCIFCLLACCCVNAIASDNFTFRNVRWGMSVDEVKASEEVPPVKDMAAAVGILMYSDYLLNKKADLTYMFDKSRRLESAMYSVKSDDASKRSRENFDKYYKKVKETLIEKYGNSPALGDKEVDSFKEVLVWMSGDTQIKLVLAIAEKIYVNVQYSSKASWKGTEKLHKEAAKQKL